MVFVYIRKDIGKAIRKLILKTKKASAANIQATTMQECLEGSFSLQKNQEGKFQNYVV